MLKSRVVFVALVAASASAQAKPFVALGTPVEFCDARPAAPACLRESAQRWRQFLAGTLPEEPHVTAMFRANVDRIDASGHQTVERGWAMSIVLPDPPSARVRKSWTIDLDGVAPTLAPNAPSFTDDHTGAFVVSIVVFADQIAPGPHTLAITSKDGKRVFEQPLQLLGEPTLAIAELASTPAESVIARDLGVALRAQVATEPVPYALVTPKDPVIATCSDDDAKCFAAIGSALHVNRLIVGKVKKTSQGFLVLLLLVDVARARFEGSKDALVPAASTKWAHDAYHELVRIE